MWRVGQGVQSLEVLLQSMGLHPGGIQLATATAVSADGRVVTGRTIDGQHYRAVLPEPRPGLLLALGLAGLARIDRRPACASETLRAD